MFCRQTLLAPQPFETPAEVGRHGKIQIFTIASNLKLTYPDIRLRIVRMTFRRKQFKIKNACVFPIVYEPYP